MQHDFHYISKRSPEVRSAYDELMAILSFVHKDLKEHYTFQHKIVGSYSRNMITFDEQSNVGFDFDVNIYPNDDDNRFSAEQIKRWFKNSLNKCSLRYGYDYAEDSTRVLTIKVKDRRNSRIIHSVDFAFVYDYEDEYGEKRQEFIHFDKRRNQYSWQEQAQGFYMLPERYQWIKDNNLNDYLKALYLKKKNNNNDPNKHSRSLFAEAVHACYNEN